MREFSNSNQQEKHGRGGDSSRRGPYQGGRGRGTVYRCYKCNQLGHRSFECIEKEDIGQRGVCVAQNERQQEQSTMAKFFPEIGESLMMNKVLLKPEKEQAKYAQRISLFRTMCKVQGK